MECAGGSADKRRWQRGQGGSTKGLQQRWTREAQYACRDALLASAPLEQRIAIRSGGGVGATAFLRAPTCSQHVVDNIAFHEALAHRLALPRPVATPTGAPLQCQLRPSGDSCCGAPLDSYGGHHARVRECGGHVVSRHNAVKDIVCRRLRGDLGVPALAEQRAPHLDRHTPTGDVQQARLDIATRIGDTTFLLDVAVVDALSTDAALLRQRAARDGLAAKAAEDRKRRRYGPAVTPLVWELGGRIGESGLAFLRRAYHGAEPGALAALLQEVGAAIAAAAAMASIAARSG